MNAQQQGMRRSLRKTWLVMLTPAAAGLTLSETLRALQLFDGWRLPGHAAIQVVLFVLAVAAGVALPILYRAAFASAHRGKSDVPAGMYYRYANNSVALSMLTPYISLLSSLLAFTSFYLVGIFLVTLYAAYTQYPSQRRITSDLRIFRVRA
ncbi:MAG: hypothetical protein RRA94_03240 [Bacteroidota bacterium]|nr:hypothetical protein [Bacteroidota bacterium]